jgi:hypothetical protein
MKGMGKRFALLAFAVGQALACTCAPPEPACAAAWTSSAVFIGTVIQMRHVPAPPIQDGPAVFSSVHLILHLEESLLGAAAQGGEVEISTPSNSPACGYYFQHGETYLVYAHRQSDGMLIVTSCGRTRPVAEAADDLKYLRHLVDAPPIAELFGSVTDTAAPRGIENGRHEPTGLPNVRITLDGGGVSKTVRTDTKGGYHFGGLAPGRYQVRASLEGYVVAMPANVMELHAKGCGEVPIGMQVDRRITGRVMDDQGRPASRVTIEVVRTRPKSENELPTAFHTAVTDEEGRYEIEYLDATTYYLGINLDRTPTALSPFTRWFYPGTERPAEAQVITVTEEPGVQNYDFVLPRPQHEHDLSGMVLWPDGRAAEHVEIFLEDPRWRWQTSAVAAETDAAGKFTVRVMDGTRYRLHAFVWVAAANESYSAEPLWLAPGAALPNPLRLILTRRGGSLHGSYDALERWRNGLGLE